MQEISADRTLIAYCGLYCGACKKFLKGKCPGCEGYEKATWCKVRTCCKEHQYSSCADCGILENPDECGKLNNFIARFFSFIFRSDRNASLAFIRGNGYESYASEMAEKGMMSFKK